MTLPKRKMARPRKAVNQDTYEGRFAARLKQLREKAGLTQQEVAEALEVSLQTIYYWESNRRQPKISDLPKIAKVLEIKKARTVLPDE